ncbi:hypothetical protein M0R45_000603 [Rubus argutus]|uniref:Uncharacterized protein n=1 Tax=Rubus argutus TaxID=59490 RepID=A0AAW1VMR3_RUBAR
MSNNQIHQITTIQTSRQLAPPSPLHLQLNPTSSLCHHQHHHRKPKIKIKTHAVINAQPPCSHEPSHAEPRRGAISDSRRCRCHLRSSQAPSSAMTVHHRRRDSSSPAQPHHHTIDPDAAKTRASL